MDFAGDIGRYSCHETHRLTEDDQERWPSLLRRVRLIMLLHASESAGITPIGIIQLHSLAYLSNVLAPVWELQPLDGKVIKRQGGPFYPVLQHDLDRLISRGLVAVVDLGHRRDFSGRWRLHGRFWLNHRFAGPIVEHYRESENHVATFISELVYAFSALSEEDLESVVLEDATYADQLTAFSGVIDFGEWRTLNFSANAANHFRWLIPGGASATLGERLHLYARHLHRRLHGTGTR